MKRYLVSLLLVLNFIFTPHLSHAALPVIDTATIAQMIQQIRQTLQVISQLDDLNKWEEIDHINLAGGKFGRFLSTYKNLFDQVMKQIESYQSGGAFGQIGRIEGDEIYPGYHEGWEKKDELGQEWRTLKKQIVWTKIQMKHAAIVGAKVRSSLADTEKQTNILLQDTLESVGVMQSIKIGNQLTGMVSKNLQQLNVQLGEFVQAYTASELEANFKRGKQANRLQEAIEDFGTYKPGPILPRNPVGAYSK